MFVGIDSLPNFRFRLIHLGDTMVTVDPDTFGARLQAAGFATAKIGKHKNRFRFRAQAPLVTAHGSQRLQRTPLPVVGWLAAC
jgi:hypothetical protein